MLPDNHRQITLRSGTGYDGRIDPVRKVQIHPQETVIECQLKQEIISLSGWKMLEEFPFCNFPTGNVLGPSGELAVRPKKTPSAPQYVESRWNYRIRVLISLLLIACLGISVVMLYFAPIDSDTGVTGILPTPEPIAETLVISQITSEPSATSQPTVAAIAPPQPTAITLPDPLETIVEYIALLNDRQYEQAFAILSDDFKSRNHGCEADGNYSIQPFIVYWHTVERLVLVDLFLESHSESQAVANAI